VIDQTSKKRTLACTSTSERGKTVCKSLGIYTELTPND